MKQAVPWIGLDAVVLRLRRYVNSAGGQKNFAAKHGMSPQYVNDVLQGHRLPGKKITAALGLEKALLWRTPAK